MLDQTHSLMNCPASTMQPADKSGTKVSPSAAQTIKVACSNCNLRELCMPLGLTEEELALFDILTKPEPVLTKAEEAQVKKVCRELLATLKREKLVLDWREKQQAKAGVMQTLKFEFRSLPSPYTREVRVEKLARAYAHVFDHYTGQGHAL